MVVLAKGQFLEARTLKEKGITFAVFGFQEDFDRRDFLVPTELITQLPVHPGVECEVQIQVLKRFDGKEDLRLMSCKSLATATSKPA